MFKNPEHPNEPICKYMRSKASAIPVADDDFYMSFHYDYEQFYCQRTLHAVGPDDLPVCPEDCYSRRSCYVPHPAGKMLAFGENKTDSSRG